ncbi:ATP-binding protein [Candidatus Woesearchaeota archaeon]|nr:ATP-binding protein [Candidatus Woesearchaeota archaeon]
MSLDDVLSPDLVKKNKRFVVKEYSSFLNSQSFSCNIKDVDYVKNHQLLFLGGFYAAKDSLSGDVKHLDDSFQRMYFSAVSSVNLLNSFEGVDFGFPLNFGSLNFSVSDYESNLRILKKHVDEVSKYDDFVNSSYSYFCGLNDFLFSFLKDSVDDKLIKFKDRKSKINGSNIVPVKVNGVDSVDLENISFVETSYDDIIGNVVVKDSLDLSMRKLFLYNSERKNNPALEKMQFKQNFLLVGESGNGKGMLAAYAASVGSDLASKLDKDLRIVSMENNSSYQDGPILKLLSYLKNISNSDDLFLVILDEVDSVFSSRVDYKTQNYQKKLVTELLKFTSNSVEYVNKGNYVLIAMTNTPNQLDPAFLNRLNKGTYLCEGPKSVDEKILLVKNLIYKLVPDDVVRVKDWNKIGGVAYDLGLSGRELKDCVENLFESSCLNGLPSNIYGLDYDKQLSFFNDFKVIDDSVILDGIIKTGERRKVDNYLLRGGYVESV